MTVVGLLGDGPAVEAVRAALGDAAADPTHVDAAAAGQVDLAVCVGAATDGIDDAAGVVRASGTPHVVVELGGVGGRPVAGVDAAVSGHAPGTACYDCLRQRVAAVGEETAGSEVDAATARYAGAVAGREAAVLVDGGESPVLGGVIEVPHERRRLLPVPGCDCATGRDRSLALDERERSLEAALASAEAAFDARLGPVTAVAEAESFPVPYYIATLSSTPFADMDPPDHAAGVAADWDPAFMKALGEALERYSAAAHRTATLESDPATPLAPSRFVQPGDPVAAGAVEAWYPADRLADGESVHLPAEVVLFPPPARRIRPAVTTGLGLGNGGVGAVLSGLYEVIERDAAMLAWYSTYEPVGLAVDDGAYETLAARARSEDLAVTALSLTQDVDVPVVAACVHRDGEWPRFAAGMAASLDPTSAAREALEEALQNWTELRRMGPDRAADESGAIGRYADLPAAARAFVDPGTTVPAGTVGPEAIPEGRAALEAVIERLAAADMAVYAARLTPRDVEGLGFEAVRVVLPRAQPLFTGDAYFGERARTVPGTFGYEPRLDRDHHPFP
ncbi:bacteriocin biosynthesis protein SagD [Halobacteriales archaeon QS_1_69_70]|nr:MAG: bacteriocin biosynthesis protein SagD [Halobacteriales archaeon QS_1_69_70]